MIKKGLNAGQLKLIAAIAMLLDHCVFLFLENFFGVAVVLNIIGRLTMPIMCYFVAEGFYHTKDVKKYLMRMAVFAIISQIPYYINHIDVLPTSLYELIKGNILRMNVICTLFMGLLSLCIVKSKMHIVAKILLVILCVELTRFCDWRYYGVLWILGFGIFRGSFLKQTIAFIVILIIRLTNYDGLFTILMNSTVLLALPLLYLYNGEKGKQTKYGFYIFYPAHLLVLGLVKIFM